jgi:two-component sensor histidine kinase
VKTAFLHHLVWQLLETISQIEKLTAETAHPEDVADECRNLLEYQSNRMTCMKDGTLSVGLMKTK